MDPDPDPDLDRSSPRYRERDFGASVRRAGGTPVAAGTSNRLRLGSLSAPGARVGGLLLERFQ